MEMDQRTSPVVFPASAGMIPRVFQIAQFDVGVPRKRGDDPLVFMFNVS